MTRLSLYLWLTFLLLAAAAHAQSVTIQVGPISVTPAPPPFTQPASVTVKQSVTVNGASYAVTGTLSGVLTFTPTTGGTTGATTGSTTTTGTTTGGTTTGATTGTTTGAATGSTTGSTTGPWSLGAIYSPAGVAVTTAASGTTVTLHGNLPAGSTVTAAGLPATVINASAGQLVVVLPTVTANTTGPLVVTTPDGTILTSPPFTITGGVAVLPTGPLGNTPAMGVAGYANAAGYWTDAFAPGDPVRILGWGFGTAPGTVTVDAVTAQITAWQDRLIQIVLPLNLFTGPSGGANLAVSRPDGAGEDLMGFNIVPRVPAQVRRPAPRR